MTTNNSKAPRITNSMREATASVAACERPAWGEETLWRAASAGLIEYADGEWHVTAAGRDVVAEFEAKRAKQRARSRARSRARADVMRSLGLRRTRCGWE